MPRFLYRLEGRDDMHRIVDCADLAAARVGAVRYLGAFLADHPDFAEEGHWRVNVEADGGDVLLHVIVATVTARQHREV